MSVDLIVAGVEEGHLHRREMKVTALPSVTKYTCPFYCVLGLNADTTEIYI
jgi:hypothetical protein